MEEDLHGVGNGALVGIEVVARVNLVLNDGHLRAQGVDARVGGDLVLVMVGGERTEDEADGGHVLQAVVAVGGIVERTGLVDDADGRLVRGEFDARDPVEAILDERVEFEGAFHGGLRVKLGGEGDLEEHVLHHVAAEGAGESHRLALE